jgi:hypothetical protein
MAYVEPKDHTQYMIPAPEVSQDTVLEDSGGGQNFLTEGDITSPNYVPETLGWRLSSDGTSEIQNLVTNISQSVKSFTAGQALAAGDAVYVADGAETNNEVSQATSDASTTTYTSASTNRLGQHFYFPASPLHRTISKITFRMLKNGGPSGSLTVSLYATSGDFPTGSALSTGSKTYASITVDNDYDVTMSAYTMSANTHYAIVIDPGSGVSVGNNVDFFFKNGESLSNAGIITSTDSGGSWANGGATESITSEEDLDFVLVTIATAGRIYKTSAATAEDSDNFVGFCKNTTVYGEEVPVIISGEVTDLSGITTGAKYYLSDTRGAISTSAGTVSKKAGVGMTSTSLVITNIW